MKWLILTTAFAGAATAQGSEILPPCGQVCFTNMLGLSVSLGCPLVNGNPDGACLCGNPDFGYGIRDCANEACPPEHVGAVISYGLSYCQAAAVVPASGQIKDTPTPAALTALGTTTGAAETKVSSPSPSASANPSGKVAGADIVSTFTSGDKTITTTLQSISALATGVPDKHDSDDGPSSGVRGHNKDNNDSSSSTTLATQADAADVTGSGDEATETTTRVATSSLHGGVAPMVTGALNGLSNAPVVIAAAAALLI